MSEQIPEYQQRVITERDSLVSKKVALSTFILSEAFATVEEAEKKRMLHQEVVMGEYIQILDDRINNFPNE